MLKALEIRKAKGISRSALSRLSCVPLRTLEDLEKGADPRVSTLYKIAKALEVSLDDLYREGQ